MHHRTFAVVFAGLFALFACACACARTPRSPHPPAHARAQPAPRTSGQAPRTSTPRSPARWHFDGPAIYLHQLALGDGRVLYVGAGGRRVLIGPDGSRAEAATIADTDLAGALRAPSGELALVTRRGDVYFVKEPLEPLGTPRRAPTPIPDWRVAIGKQAIVAVTEDHRLLRSIDLGQSWQSVDYSRGALWGAPSWVVLDGRGNGLLSHLPRRMFVTHDDGATWAPIAAPGVCGMSLDRDGEEQLFCGACRLDGDAFAAPPRTKRERVVLRDPLPDDDGAVPVGAGWPSPLHVVAGEHFVRLWRVQGDPPTLVHIDSQGPDGAAPFRATSTELYDGGPFFSRHVSAWGASILYLRLDTERATSTLLSSDDHGRSWAAVLTLPGVVGPDAARPAVKLGPRGWAYIGGLTHEDGTVERSRLRPAGATAFQEVAVEGDFTPDVFVFDEARGRVFAIDDKHVYASPLEKNAFVDLGVSFEGYIKGASLDDAGVLRLFRRALNGGIEVLGREARGALLPPAYLAVREHDSRLSFAGARGLLVEETRTWETADGGVTWSRVASAGQYDASCAPAGCVAGGHFRLGWDLPARATSEVLRLTSAATARPSAPSHVPPEPAAPAAELSCRVVGAPVGVNEMPALEGAALSPDVRWVEERREHDGEVALRVFGKGRARLVSLLAADAGSDSRTDVTTGPMGVVATRRSMRRSPESGVERSELDVGWFSFPDNKSFARARIATGGSSSPRVDARIVAGGGVVYTLDGAPAFFSLDGVGKVERVARPFGAVGDLVRVGARWLIVEPTRMFPAQGARLGWSDDGGRTWLEKTWPLGDDSDAKRVALRMHAGRPYLALPTDARGAFTSAALFGIEPPILDEPPAPVLVDVVPTVNAPCAGASGPLRVVLRVPPSRPSFTVRVQGAAPSLLTATRRLVFGLTTGNGCTAAYELTDASGRALVFSDADGWAGWRIRGSSNEHASALSAEPIRCN